jgi:Cysteine-rich secretory protein family
MTGKRKVRFSVGLVLTVIVGMATLAQVALAQDADEQRLLDLTNQARAEGGLKPVAWDASLAAAARAHAELMSKEPEISHRYNGEQDLSARAAQAGAHFSVIAENVAQGTSPGQIHGSWMQSQAHHDNLMNANIDHVGIAIVRARGALYAVVDFTRSVDALKPTEVESKVGAILTGKGLTLADSAGARQYCALEDGSPSAALGLKARFMMRWQSSDLSSLPPKLEQTLAGGGFKQVSVGACAPKGGGAAGAPVFSGYRVAVLLF